MAGERPYRRQSPESVPFCDSSTATGRVAANSENTIAMTAVIGTARNAPDRPHSPYQIDRLTRIATGERLSELPSR